MPPSNRRRQRPSSNKRMPTPEYIIVTGGLPDEPLGELPDDEAKTEAIRVAALPRKIRLNSGF